MPEVIVTYERPKTLKILNALAEYFDFVISSPRSKKKSKMGATTFRRSDATEPIDDASMNDDMQRAKRTKKSMAAKK